MTKSTTSYPWSFLDAFRGTVFNAQWPTFPQMMMISAGRYPDSPCFTDFDGPDGSKRTLTYSQVLAQVQTLAKWMISQGIKNGDTVAVSGKNSPEWATVFLAALFAGAVIVPIDYALHENEMENLIETAKPKLLFIDEDKFKYFCEHAGGFTVLSLSPKFPDVYIRNLTADGDVADNPPAQSHDTAAILFTSGTTGRPKGVMLTHENFVSDCYIAQLNFNHGNGDVFYALLPIHHAYTMQAAFINPLSTGAEIVFGKSMAVSRLMRELREGKITVMLGVPLLYNKLLAGIKKGIRDKGIVVAGAMKLLMNVSYLVKKITKKDPGRILFRPVLEQANIATLRVAICGGGPLSASVFKAYNAAGINFIQGYGLTETSPIIALNPVDHFKIDSVGKDFAPYEDIRILHPDKDGIGEIAVKGPMVMKGYYNMPEETAKVFTDDGYFKTGDIGSLDDEHYLRLCGRAKNIIVTSGGKNVYPEEIEDAFQLYDDIQQIVVQGYIEDKTTNSEGIEALIYPGDLIYDRLKITRTDSFSSDDVLEIIQNDVDAVNRTLQPYARISKVTILEQPMETTTTLKIKRNYTK
jgi:long-chain acyl-CoA synthetase